MPLTLELPEDLASALTAEATRLGMSLPDYALHLLTTARPQVAGVRTGADLVTFWKAEGLVGTRCGIIDSQAEVRRLREQ